MYAHPLRHAKMHILHIYPQQLLRNDWENKKIQKSKNPKMQRTSNTLTIQTFLQDSVDVKSFGFLDFRSFVFRIFGFLGFHDFLIFLIFFLDFWSFEVLIFVVFFCGFAFYLIVVLCFWYTFAVSNVFRRVPKTESFSLHRERGVYCLLELILRFVLQLLQVALLPKL